MCNMLHICRITMGKEDWVTIKIPALMVQAIDKFVETDDAKRNGVFSRNEFVTRVLVMWFANYEKEFGMFVPREFRRSIHNDDITKPFD